MHIQVLMAEYECVMEFCLESRKKMMKNIFGTLASESTGLYGTASLVDFWPQTHAVIHRDKFCVPRQELLQSRQKQLHLETKRPPGEMRDMEQWVGATAQLLEVNCEDVCWYTVYFSWASLYHMTLLTWVNYNWKCHPLQIHFQQKKSCQRFILNYISFKSSHFTQSS